jgi:hypothetical protein
VSSPCRGREISRFGHAEICVVLLHGASLIHVISDIRRISEVVDTEEHPDSTHRLTPALSAAYPQTGSSQY